MVAYIYELTETLNNKVNEEKLDLEIRASVISNYKKPPYLVTGRIFVEFNQDASASDRIVLDEIISLHNGELAEVSEVHVQERERKIREMTEMALYHPLLSEHETVQYLTSIDNHFNGWKRSGVNSVLIAKIQTDANDTTHPQYDFLNEIVSPEGNKTFEFLLSIIIS